jgi:hypothetical protein
MVKMNLKDSMLFLRFLFKSNVIDLWKLLLKGRTYYDVGLLGMLLLLISKAPQIIILNKTQTIIILYISIFFVIIGKIIMEWTSGKWRVP